MHDAQILVAIVPAEIKDDVVDILITLEPISGFNLTRIAGFSREHSHFSLREQVEGHCEMYRFEVMHEPAQEAILLEALGQVCEVAQARYWILPLRAMGHFGEPPGEQ